MKNIKNIINNIKGMFSENLKGEEAEYALEVDGDVNVVNGNYLVNGIPVSGSGGGTLFGDVIGAITANSINALQGNSLDLAGIASGSVLTYDGIKIIAEIKEAAASSLESYRQVRVDPEYGDNLTGEVGNLGKPFQTISGALDAINNQLDPCTVLLPTNIEESVVVDMSQGVVAFAPFAGKTDWNGESGVPIFNVAAGTSIQFYNINFSGNDEAVGVGTGTGNETVFFIDCSLESNRNSTDPLVNFEKISCAYFNTQVASGTPIHTDCPIIIFTSPVFTLDLDNFIVDAPTESSFFVLLTSFISKVTVSGNSSLLALPGATVAGVLTLTNLTDDSVIDFLGQCGTLIVDPKGSIILNGSTVNNLIINNSVDPFVVSATGITVREQVSIGTNINLIADGAFIHTNNFSMGIGAETSGWNRFNAGGGAVNWYDPAIGFIGSGQTGNISQPFPSLQEAVDAANSNFTINILPGNFSADVTGTSSPLAFQGPGNRWSQWSAVSGPCFTGFDNFSFEDLNFQCFSGEAIQLSGGGLFVSKCEFTGTDSIAVDDSTVVIKNSKLNGTLDIEQCPNIELSDTQFLGSIVRVSSTTNASSLAITNSKLSTALVITGSVDVAIDKNTSATIIDATNWDNFLSTPKFLFNGSCATLDITPFASSVIDLNSCSCSGTITINDVLGTNNILLDNATLTNLDLSAGSSAGPAIVSAINANIRGTITIGNDITLDLSGARYDADQITLIGTGTYINDRTTQITGGPGITVNTIIPDHFEISGSIGGDVSGSLDSVTVVKLQSNDLSVPMPTSGSNLQFDGTTWVDTPQPVLQGEFYNCIYVDSAKGDDATGERGNINKPFATVQGAYDTVALDDDIIIIANQHNESCYLTGGASTITISGKGNGLLASVNTGVGPSVWVGESGITALTTDDVSLKLQDIYIVGDGAAAANFFCNGNARIHLKNVDFNAFGPPDETAAIVEAVGVEVDNVMCRGVFIIESGYADYYNCRVTRGGTLIEQQIVPAGIGDHVFHTGRYGIIAPVGGPTITVRPSVTTTGFLGASLDDTDSSPNISFLGSAQAFISPAIGSINLNGATIYLACTIQDAGAMTSTGLDLIGTNILGNLNLQEQTITPITANLSFATIGGSCTIGDNVEAVLSGARYSPSGVIIPGTGTYYDMLNERIMVTPIQDTTFVSPRDALVLADNTVGVATVQLGPASLSCGEITIHAQDSPAVNDVEIYADGIDTINGDPSPYVMNGAHPRTITFRADTANGNWVIIATTNV